MSTSAMSRFPCQSCQGDVFDSVWQDDPSLGRVHYLRCVNCGLTIPDLTPEQVAIQDRADEEAEAFHERQVRLYQMDLLRESDPQLFRPYTVRNADGVTYGHYETLDDAYQGVKAGREHGFFSEDDTFTVVRHHSYYDEGLHRVVRITRDREVKVAEGVVL